MERSTQLCQPSMSHLGWKLGGGLHFIRQLLDHCGKDNIHMPEKNALDLNGAWTSGPPIGCIFWCKCRLAWTLVLLQKMQIPGVGCECGISVVWDAHVVCFVYVVLQHEMEILNMCDSKFQQGLDFRMHEIMLFARSAVKLSGVWIQTDAVYEVDMHVAGLSFNSRSSNPKKSKGTINFRSTFEYSKEFVLRTTTGVLDLKSKKLLLPPEIGLAAPSMARQKPFNHRS